MKSCPECESDLTDCVKQGILSLCSQCDDWVLPYEIKDPKKKNYRDRNAGKFSSLPKSTTRIKPVSRKLNIKLKGYAESKSSQEVNIDCCAKCNSPFNLTRHHVAGRSGFYHDGRPCIEVWVYLCLECHDAVHANGNQAMKEGWLQPEYRNQIQNGKRIEPWRK
jgi:hypothetical protein